jgi:hypothetical protein
MKIILFLLILSASTLASVDTVKKWTDEKGKVHYGDIEAAEDVKKVETLKIEDTYDQQSYEEGIQRHKETEKFGDQYEKERLAEEKRKQEEADSKPSSAAPPAGGTAVIPARNRSLRNDPRRPGSGVGERPINLPAKIK